ncbi:hypothetical protein BDBG_16722 [Blastomyces gilchristii SLH14081]|uniref:Uncharacterized protein n=1 Tax=Blastomyces gilchristii (strain SLH14081) TaxID=559298 RepID=A0A179UG71_BLAGS|nr:uncharacterized protein BDBG_16722 [Blastomyces gilchristii SLH14081]OAT06840.1 hypothetical protein BDBG_16722 [Blastomyces gilchristii SLH14081]
MHLLHYSGSEEVKISVIVLIRDSKHTILISNINRSTTNSLDFSNKNPPIDPSKSPRSYEHFDPIADRIPRVVVELSSQT